MREVGDASRRLWQSSDVTDNCREIFILGGRCPHSWQEYEGALCHSKKADTQKLQHLREDQW